jgi:hypothetical protein
MCDREKEVAATWDKQEENIDVESERTKEIKVVYDCNTQHREGDFRDSALGCVFGRLITSHNDPIFVS